MTSTTLTVGTRVRLNHIIDRYPHFQVAAGAKGTVTDANEYTIAVRMDDHIPGCEDWDNEIIWSDADDIDADVEIIA